MEMTNGILVSLDFLTGNATVAEKDHSEFSTLVERINVDTSKTSSYCFFQKKNDYMIHTLDFEHANRVKEADVFGDYIMAAWGKIFVKLTLTNGETREFVTCFDRFWLNTENDELKIIQYDDIVKRKVGLI